MIVKVTEATSIHDGYADWLGVEMLADPETSVERLRITSR